MADVRKNPGMAPPLVQLYLNVHSSRKIELHQGVHRLLRRVHDVQETLMGPDLKLLTGLLVLVR